MPSSNQRSASPAAARRMSKDETLNTRVGVCSLKKSNRKTLAISVLPDGQIELRAPRAATRDAIIAKVEKRAGWIASKRWEFSQLNVSRPDLVYKSGATHRYLGRQYRLRVTKGSDECVSLRGAFFHIQSPLATEEATKRQLEQWMRTKAAAQFGKRLNEWSDWCRRNDLPEPQLQLRAMPKRWGSSHPSGKILLNPDLVRTPSVCIDYVIAHEVCHLREPNHDTAFFRLLGQLFPNWREVKLRLEQSEL